MKMKISFLGAAGTVTGSKYLLTLGRQKILVDCGLFQGFKSLRERNWVEPPFDVKSIQSVLLTHAHIDHSGYLPLLVKKGFRGHIYATGTTIDLCRILLPDSGHIQEEDARRANRYGYTKHHPALPLYTFDEAQVALQYFKSVAYEKKQYLGNDFDATWYRAGHILGSAFIQCQFKGTRILFSGDMGRPHHMILYPPHERVSSDYIVIESTYGGRVHEASDSLTRLGEIIHRTSQKGGTVLIPAFAVGRTQLILYHLFLLKKQNKIPDLPIYLDSPLAIEATEVMLRHPSEHQLSREVCESIRQMVKYLHTVDDSKAIQNNAMPKIIIAASGMITGGRVLHHIKYYAPYHQNCIVLVGHQVEGTRGGRLVAGERSIKLLGQFVDIRASVEILSNLSAHADSKELIDWLSTLKEAPKHVFITHGAPTSAAALKSQIVETLGWSCSIPEHGDTEVL